jgi:four helix bundle protein
MSESIVKTKSVQFAIGVLNLYKLLVSERKEFVMSKKLLRSGTSVGANISEATNGERTADFVQNFPFRKRNVTKLYICLNYCRKPIL